MHAGTKQEPEYTRDIGAGVFTWGERALHRYFPSLGAAAASHPGLAAEKSHKKALYYTFHASLVLWNASFGHAYPSLRFWWRIELDVPHRHVESRAHLANRPTGAPSG